MMPMNASLSLRSLVLALGFAAGSAGGLITRAHADVITVAGSDGTTAPAWEEIKGDTYDQRAHFASGVDRLSFRLDEQIRLLKAKRAGMTTDIKDWDFNMKEVDESRSMLTSRITELKQTTTPETWADAKDKVGEAWKRSQLAVDKMNTTVTS
jgi:hypothetical protein